MWGKGRETWWKYFFKGCFFVLLLLAGLRAAVLLLYPPNAIVRTWHRFYALGEGEAQILVVGSSHAYSTFDPSVISRITGKSSYILASNSQNTVQAFFNVKEALHYQRPEAIILEAFSLDDNNNWRYGDNPDRDWKKEANIDGMRFGFTKLEAVAEQYERRNWGYALLPIARCHGNWEDFGAVNANLDFYTEGIREYSSFHPSETSMSAETARRYDQAEYNPAEWVISEANIRHFHKLASLCREEGIPFYVVMSPMYEGYIRSVNYDSCTEQIAELAESEEVIFLDCNLYYDRNPNTMLGLHTLTLSERNFFVMLLGLILLMATDYRKRKGTDFKGVLARQNIWFRWLIYYALIFGILIFGVYGPEYDASAFIYFQF